MQGPENPSQNTADQEKPTPEEQPQEEKREGFGSRFSSKEQKQLSLYIVIGIVMAELAVSVGAVIYSITTARPGADGMPDFHFPWLGYLIAVLLVPVIILLLAHLIDAVLYRPSSGGELPDGTPAGVRTFYNVVRSTPTIILLVAVVLIGVGIYYLDGVMNLLISLSDSFATLAIWLIGAFTVAWIASYAVRAVIHYKMRQMESEYAFRRDVLERTGMVLLDAKHAPVTEARLLPGSPMIETLPLPDDSDSSTKNPEDSEAPKDTTDNLEKNPKK